MDAQNRRRGLAQHLLRAALRGAAEAGASAALLHVRVENHAAQRLYRRLGAWGWRGWIFWDELGLVSNHQWLYKWPYNAINGMVEFFGMVELGMAIEMAIEMAINMVNICCKLGG